MDRILQVEDLVKEFVSGRLFGSKTAIRAADGVSFEINRGEVFVLAGESGSGKSTVAKMILKSIDADSGRIRFKGKEIRGDQESLARIRSGCQMIHQDPYDSINPRMRVFDILAEPLEIHKIGDREQRRYRIMQVLKEVKLEPRDEMARKYPHMLSGGQRQRVVLARALALNPEMIIADEPVSMLDVSIRAEILDLMSYMRKKYGISFLYITHDLATARHFGDKIAVMYKGAIVETGRIEDVLLRPRHPYTRALIDSVPDPDPANLYRRRKVDINKMHSSGVDNGCRFKERCPYAIDRCAQEPEMREIGGGQRVACFVDMEQTRQERTACIDQEVSLEKPARGSA